MSCANMPIIIEANQAIAVSGENSSILLTEEVTNKLRRLSAQVCRTFIDNWQYFVANIDSHFIHHGHVRIYLMVIDENFLIDNTIYRLLAVVPGAKPKMDSQIALSLQVAKDICSNKITFNPYSSWWACRENLPNFKENYKASIEFHQLDKQKLYLFTVGDEYKKHDIITFTKQFIVSIYKKLSCNEQFLHQYHLGELLIIPEDTDAIVHKADKDYLYLLCRLYDQEEKQYKKLYILQKQQDIAKFCCFSLKFNELQRRYLLGLDVEEKYKFFVNALSLDYVHPEEANA